MGDPRAGLAGVDELHPFGGVLLRDEPVHRHVGELRVGVVLGPVLEGQFLRLDDEVDVLGGVRLQRTDVEVLEEVQDLERGDALAVRGDLPDVPSAVAGAHRVDPGRLVVGQVFQGHDAAQLLRLRDDALGDRPFVEGGGAVSGDDAVRVGEGGVFEDVPESWNSTVGLVHALQAGEAVSPGKVAGDDRRDGEAVARVVDGRLEAPPEGQGAETLREGLPAAHAPGHAPGQGAAPRDALEPALPGLLQGPRIGRPSAGVQAEEPALLLVPEDGEEVATDPVAGRLGDAQDGVGGDRGVDAVAPGLEHVDARHRRQGLARAHHPALAGDGGPVRVARPQALVVEERTVFVHFSSRGGARSWPEKRRDRPSTGTVKKSPAVHARLL